MMFWIFRSNALDDEHHNIVYGLWMLFLVHIEALNYFDHAYPLFLENVLSYNLCFLNAPLFGFRICLSLIDKTILYMDVCLVLIWLCLLWMHG